MANDGFYDFKAQAFPILQKHGFPATVYLTTYYCERSQPVFQLACHYLFWKKQGVTIPSDSNFEWDLDLRDPEACHRTLRKILAACEKRGASGAEKNALLERIAHRLKVDYEGFLSSRIVQLLSPSETAQLAARGVDFQLHTHRHRTPLDRSLFRAEIEDNRKRLEAITGTIPKHFCYPSGVVEPDFLPWLKELGVESATTCTHGLAQPSSAPLLLPRLVDVSGLAQAEFESWVSGVRAFFPSRN